MTLTGYEVIDLHTGTILKVYGPGQRKTAARYADKKDLEYGAIRYTVKPVYKKEN